MSAETKIQWCDATINFWEGCTKVSPGCAHCYAASRNHRFSAGANWGPGAPRRKVHSAEPNARALERRAIREGRTFRVFGNSLNDWLDPEVSPAELAAMLDLVRTTPHLTWLLLTKRPELWRERLQAAHDAATFFHPEFCVWLSHWLDDSPPVNVWVGTTVEDQPRAARRCEPLHGIPAVCRFVSYEPALELVDWSGWEFIDWMIMGGESGAGARPLEVEWLWESLYWCRKNDVTPFVKQLGARVHTQNANAMEWPEAVQFREAGGTAFACARVILADHGDINQFPAELRVREFPIPLPFGVSVQR
jgi:protein gp37